MSRQPIAKLAHFGNSPAPQKKDHFALDACINLDNN